MFELFYTLQLLAQSDTLFWFPALLGTSLFVLQLLFSFLGGGSDGDDSGFFEAGQFKWLTRQALTGFLMMFGWAGLTCHREFGLEGWLSVVIAFGAGLLAMLSSAFLFHSLKKLRSPGAVFLLEDALGKEAMVYQRIPMQGIGKISLNLNGLTHEIDAVSKGEEIDSFSHVKVVEIKDNCAVVAKRVSTK